MESEVIPLKIIRTTFQDAPSEAYGSICKQRLIIVLDMEEHMGLTTAELPGIRHKIESDLPGIFPDEHCAYTHTCGGHGTSVPEHPFREEVESGADIPHLLEHVILYLLSRSSGCCAGFCGQRSIDIERGITTHFYIVLDFESKIEAIAAVDLGFELVSAWVENRRTDLDALAILDAVRQASRFVDSNPSSIR